MRLPLESVQETIVYTDYCSVSSGRSFRSPTYLFTTEWCVLVSDRTCMPLPTTVTIWSLSSVYVITYAVSLTSIIIRFSNMCQRALQYQIAHSISFRINDHEIHLAIEIYIESPSSSFTLQLFCLLSSTYLCTCDISLRTYTSIEVCRLHGYIYPS